MKKLKKSKKDVKISGVCSGIAKYLNIDVTAIRLIAIAWALTGSGVLAYFIAVLVMPEDDGID